MQQTNGHAMLNATAIKFATTFRNQFTTEHLTALMPLLIKHLSSSSVVVHTYVAAGIEKVLVTKKQIDIPTKETKFGQKELKQFLEPLFTGLFSIVDNEDRSENEYVMKAVMQGSKEVKAKDVLKRKLTESAYSIQKKNKSSQMVQIFSPKVNQELEKMSRNRNMLLEEKLKLAKKRNEGDGESGESGLSFRQRMEVFREFRKFREDFPDLSKDKVLKMFPEFKVCYDL